MPLTPFIGLSVMVHMLVIAEHKIFGPPKAKKEKDTVPAMRYVGFGIIVVVFAVVLVTAGILVRASVLEKHSSVYFVSDAVKSAEAVLSSTTTPPPQNIPQDDQIAIMGKTLAASEAPLVASAPSTTTTSTHSGPGPDDKYVGIILIAVGALLM